MVEARELIFYLRGKGKTLEEAQVGFDKGASELEETLEATDVRVENREIQIHLLAPDNNDLGIISIADDYDQAYQIVQKGVAVDTDSFDQSVIVEARYVFTTEIDLKDRVVGEDSAETGEVREFSYVLDGFGKTEQEAEQDLRTRIGEAESALGISFPGVDNRRCYVGLYKGEKESKPDLILNARGDTVETAFQSAERGFQLDRAEYSHVVKIKETYIIRVTPAQVKEAVEKGAPSPSASASAAQTTRYL